MTNRNEHNLLIDIKNLSWGYPENPSLLFHNFNFHLYKNDFVVIMGRAGVGKSTLVKFLLGEFKAPPKTIYHKNEDLSRYNEEEMQKYRRQIGTVFQNYRLMEDLTVQENIEYPLKLYGVGDSTIHRRLNELKKSLDLHHILDKSVKFLSSGEKQKVSIARALIHKPEFIIADEPTGNLDRENTQQIADHLIEANKSGNTVLLITHDIHLLEYLKLKHKIILKTMS